MAPKKNNNNNDEKTSSDTAQDNNNNNSSQQRQNKDANNNNKEKSGNSQRIGGDGPRSKPVSRSQRAVSSIDISFLLLEILYLSGCDLSRSSNSTSFKKSQSFNSSS